ncbi:class II aldolase/adducin family protein [Magnetospira sp. QH-2]|uniref:class II aldolase/adducin family protein n=1 Tax=Magnetospira sp. (strain QH-2) TaxID=1288970 RepID=UPI0003E81893|nr:class II aldolase/adducin family protein [Magnetospira sp. QH-2]CCQ75289.1 L-fuculose phosphate aldolase [Magnetospira sp. QH-2]
MNHDHTDAARTVIHTALAMNAQGLNRGSAGNVSLRLGDGFLVTPSGMAYPDLLPEDVVWVGLDGRWDRHGRKPSSEWQFHQAIYAARPEINAVVHTHSSFASTLAVLERDIPPFHYMVAAAGGRDIRCAPYATTGSPELAETTVTALAGRRACLLAHHGLIACGPDAERALDLAAEVEDLAKIYVQALAIAEPPRLEDAEMTRMQEIFKAYGANAQD